MRAYLSWLKAYVNHTRYSESPDAFHLWTGVSVIAGALRRRVWIDQRHFQWTPNFYIVLVGPPGVAAKSTTMRAGLSLLERVEGIYFGPQSMTWQALTEALSKAKETVEFPDNHPPEVMSCLTVAASELGTFLRPEDDELVEVLIAMWDGQKEVWRRSTRTQGDTTVENPWLNVIACTTPAWLRANFPDVMIGGGLTSRIMFIYADRKRQLVAYPADLITSSEFQKEANYLIHDLQQIAEMKGEMRLTPDAKKWGNNWYEQHWTMATSNHLSSERYAGYFARKQTHLHKLAMVVSASRSNDLWITLEDVVMANALVSSIERDMERVFTSIGVNQQAQRSGEVLRFIEAVGKIDYQDLWRKCFPIMGPKEFADSIAAITQAGYARVEKTSDGRNFLVANKRPASAPVAAPPQHSDTDPEVPPTPDADI